MQSDAAFLIFGYNKILHFSAKHSSYVQSSNLRKLDVPVLVNDDIDDNRRL
jgi:hypothetical protein